jgi:heme-degrading monooxygenase HmoA
MYGTVAHLRVQAGRGDDLARLAASYDVLDIPGFVATYVYRLDRDPDAYVMAVLFEDRESYRRNADDPEQDRRYEEMRDLLVADPEWHDGEIVWATAAR